MKSLKLAPSLLAILLNAGVFAASPPDLMNYQGVLRDSFDAPLNGTYLMVFRFIDAAGGGIEIMVDEHGDAAGGTVVVSNGLFNVQLGSGTVSDGTGPGTYTNLADVFRDYDNVLLRVEVEGETLSPDVRIIAAAYAHNTTHFAGLNSEQVLRSDVDDTMFGKAWFAGAPVSSSVSGGPVYISPNSAGVDNTLLGLAVSSVEKFRVDAEGDAFLSGRLVVNGSSGFGNGVEASGMAAGGYFVDSDNSGYALTGIGDRGIEAYGDAMGGLFSDRNSSGQAYVAIGDRGIEGYGDNMGGYFKDTNHTGFAYVGHVDRGIWGYGSVMGGYFKDSDSSGFAEVGFGDWGIQAYGNTGGGYFLDQNDGGEAYLGYGFNGVRADSGNAGFEAVFATNPNGTWAALARDGISTAGSGSKNFVQNHPYDKDKVIRYKSLEGDEVGTYTRGSGRLDDGLARITLGETFQWVTNPDIGLTAQITARGPSADLYVESLSATEIVVRGTRGSRIAFDYVVHGLRIGFEEQSVVAKKRYESLIPRMEVDSDLFEREPDLRNYTALARFKRMVAASAPDSFLDLTRAESLRDSIGQYDPNIHGPVDSLLGFGGMGKTEETQQSPATDPAIDTAAPRGSTESGPTQTAAISVTPQPATESATPNVATTTLLPVSIPVQIGEVLVLDSEQPGSLRPGTITADTAVAGIATSSGELNAGVAFSGLVICKVDAGYGAIRVGDLLTVSPTPGHAMLSVDARPGTILGKAAEPLDVGTGEIIILITLR